MRSPFDFKPTDVIQADAARTKSAAKAYLIALALSPYAYHLDDPVRTIVWTVPITPIQKRHLLRMSCVIGSVLTYEERWDIYHAASMAAGTTELVLD